MVLSVSAAFAVSDDATLNEVDDGIDLAVAEDAVGDDVVDGSNLQAQDSSNDNLKASAVVTNDTYSNFINQSGHITSDADELIFEGDFSSLAPTFIYVNQTKPIKLTGNNAVFNGVHFCIQSDNVTIDGFSFSHSNIYLVYADHVNNITLSNNKINMTAVANTDNYPILAKCVENFKLINNTIAFTGNNCSTAINNAVRILGDSKNKNPSKNIVVEGNNFTISIPSVEVGYDSDYKSTVYSEGILFFYCEDLKFIDNRVTIRYNSFDLGQYGYDTIYGVSIRSDSSIYEMDWDDDDNLILTYPVVSKNVTVKDNEFNVIGHNDTYGLVVSADNYEVSNNNFNVTADIYCAHGINIVEPSINGVVKDNNITTKAMKAVYGIYGYQSMAPIQNMTYENNKIVGDAYASCGMELVECNPYIVDNTIISEGNNTYGMALSIRDNGTVINNNISCLGNNIGAIGTGDGYIPANSSMAISIKGDALIKGNNITSTDIGINALLRGNIVIDQNNINVTANNNVADNYAIKVNGIEKVTISNNNVTFVGITKGVGISNAVYVLDSDNSVIKKNKFDLSLSSVLVPWAEIPSGSGNWVPSPVSEGIVVDSSDNVVFEENTVISIYNYVDPTLSWGSPADTIYVVDFVDSNNAAIKGNTIDATGYTYIYAITISGNCANISANDINVKADSHDAVGIEVKCNGVIENNNISATAPNIAYGILPGMSLIPISIDVVGNNISGDAYYACGISVSGEKLNAEANDISLNGNYTVGINSNANTLTANGNTIVANATNEGNVTLSGIPTVTLGVSVNGGVATISENTIESTANTAVELGNTKSIVENNIVIANNTSGDSAISSTGNATIKGNGVIKTVLTGIDASGVYGNVIYTVNLTYENGTAIAGKTITFTVDKATFSAKTDEKGIATVNIDTVGKGTHTIEASYAGNGSDVGATTTNTLSISPKEAKLEYQNSVTVLMTAVKKGSYYKITLKDVDGKVVDGGEVKVVFNGVTQVLTTDKNGVANFKLSASKEGTYKLTMSVDDGKYIVSTATATIKINKEATKLTAKKKTFKAKVKTKKYTAVLKDSKGKAIGKVKVTLKVKGKTYKATTNAKGKVTFKIKNLKKKGKYTATIKFAGNNLYKAVTKKVKITVKK